MAIEVVVVLSVAALFAGMLLLSVIGRRIGVARFKRDPEAATTEGGAAEAAVFGLLGLLIAFTFSGAASRFETRRQLIGEEANAIGTAYLRVDLLPDDSQPELRDLFRRYVDLRATVYQSALDQAETIARLNAGDALQREIWTKALAAAATARGAGPSHHPAGAGAERDDRHHDDAGGGEPEPSAARRVHPAGDACAWSAPC